MTRFTHRKHPYHAQCIQWDGTNTEAVTEMIPDQIDITNHINGNTYVMIRMVSGDIATLSKGWWVVKGENGKVKYYDNETFLVKYERIPATHLISHAIAMEAFRNVMAGIETGVSLEERFQKLLTEG